MGLSELLDQVQSADLLRFVTAGSVDDGKSTLIGRLLHDAQGLYDDQLEAVRGASRQEPGQIDWALVTDGLRAEREQRITIDVAYRHFSTPRRRFIIADTPGHEEYTRNMVTGASTADLAVILIDATQGVLPQSKRHGYLTTLLGIRRLVVAVNKMDLVDWRRDVFEAVRDEYLAWSASLPACELTFIPVSALLGDNVVERSRNMPWSDAPPLLRYLETVPLGVGVGGAPLRFPIQLVLRPNSDFRGYSGRLASGAARLGDEVVVLPSGRTSRVSRILGPQGDVDAAVAPQSVTLCLTDAVDAGRGHLIAPPDALPHSATRLAATLIWMDGEPLRIGRPYLLKHATGSSRATVTALRHVTNPNDLSRQPAEALALNEIGEAELTLVRPLLCDAYDRHRATGGFIVIDPDHNGTVGAGLIREVLQSTPTEPSAGESRRLVVRHHGRVTPEARRALFGQTPVCLWLTGLSGAGKSTLAYALEERLIGSGRACVVLDGDNIRHGLCCDLGFSPADRGENIRRVAEVAKLFCEAGLIVITAFISPYVADRAAARAVIGEARFAEVFCDAPLEVCEARDPKGLYRKARAGELPEFTGVSAPYEAPPAPDLRLDTGAADLDSLLATVEVFLDTRADHQGGDG